MAEILNKPIVIGIAIPDLAKLWMHQFYYDVNKKIWFRNELVTSDTDSLFLNI